MRILVKNFLKVDTIARIKAAQLNPWVQRDHCLVQASRIANVIANLPFEAGVVFNPKGFIQSCSTGDEESVIQRVYTNAVNLHNHPIE
jgi:hypothetical protein